MNSLHLILILTMVVIFLNNEWRELIFEYCKFNLGLRPWIWVNKSIYRTALFYSEFSKSEPWPTFRTYFIVLTETFLTYHSLFVFDIWIPLIYTIYKFWVNVWLITIRNDSTYFLILTRDSLPSDTFSRGLAILHFTISVKIKLFALMEEGIP